MKKLLLVAAVATLSITAAQAAPTIYGKAFLTLDVQDGDDEIADTFDNRTQLNSNSSRIGFKGSEALSANTDLVYQLEYGIKVDDDTSSRQFASRDTYLGLSNKQYGTVLAGRLTAIDDMINYGNVTVGAPIGGDNILSGFDAPRANNAIAYVSPNYSGINFLGMYVLDEDKDGTKTTDSLGRDAFGVGVKYEPNGAPYRGGITYIQADEGVLAKDSAGNPLVLFKSATRISGAYDLNAATTIGALYQLTDYSTDDNENSFTVSVEHKLPQTPWKAYGQLDYVTNLEGKKDLDNQRVVVGSKYTFNKATTGHVYGSFARADNGDINGNAYGVGAGIEYKF